jgi:hypothetical protein
VRRTGAYGRFHIIAFSVISLLFSILWYCDSGWEAFLYLMCVPTKVVEQYQFWRLLTGLYICNGIFMLIITAYMYRIHCNNRELEIGTSRFMLFFLINGSLMSLVVVVIFFIIT